MEIQQATSNTSPTHEFSFTNSLNSSSTPNPSTIDLTPADEIFFHGQLLPLQLLSTDHFSPRSSLDDFAPPRRNNLMVNIDHKAISIGHSFNSYEYSTKNKNGESLCKERAKSKSFSLLRRRSKEGEIEEEEQREKIKKKKRRLFDMGHFLKKYMKIFSKERREDIQFRKKPYSFSGKMSLRDLRGRREEFSAPASMRTSPSNSGILMADSRATLHCSNDSSMEELQAAIQSAIAHCKNSFAIADNKAMVS